MNFLDINMTVSFNEELTEEELKELAEDIVSSILKQKVVKGVGYDTEIRESYKEKIPF